LSANPLFLIAAIFNWIVGGLLLFAYPLVSRMLGIEGPPDVFFHIVAGIVVLFGFAYWLIWRDSARFRLFIHFGAAAKLVFVVAIYAHWLMGSASAMLALLVSADLVFAFLFLAYLGRTSLHFSS
jgi:hypothetical protein